MNPDQTAPKEQYDLGPYCLQYMLPKSISRPEGTDTKVMTDGLSIDMFTVLIYVFIFFNQTGSWKMVIMDRGP